MLQNNVLSVQKEDPAHHAWYYDCVLLTCPFTCDLFFNEYDCGYMPVGFGYSLFFSAKCE